MKPTKGGKILLPTTSKDFDRLVKTLVKKYKLPNEDHAAAVVAQRIMHLPPDQAMTTLEYLGHSVLKNMANQLAANKGRGIAHRFQVDELSFQLTADPNNQQARDTLEKAANDGSEYAKQALANLQPPSAAVCEPTQNQEA